MAANQSVSGIRIFNLSSQNPSSSLATLTKIKNDPIHALQRGKWIFFS